MRLMGLCLLPEACFVEGGHGVDYLAISLIYMNLRRFFRLARFFLIKWTDCVIIHWESATIMLFDSRIEESSISLRISSEKGLVEKALTSCKRFLKRHRVVQTEDITIVLRELADNAIRHGNQNDPDAIVSCSVVHLGGGRFKVVVEDEGPGFDYNAVRMSLPEDPRRLARRGYVLVKSLSERLEFNECGNCVTAYVVAGNDKQQAMKEVYT